METVGIWVITLLGISLVAVAYIDAFVTILHVDHVGPIATFVQRTFWRISIALAMWLPGMRRHLIAAAGPVMLAFTALTWMILFIVGNALIVWPRSDAYRSEPEIGSLTFIDALYYSGVTVTALGYGDISPATPELKMLTVAMSGLGFALITGIITYVLNVLNGVTERNTYAIRVRSETGWTGDGVHFVVRSLRDEDISDVRLRFKSLTGSLQKLQELLHHYPLIDLYYRAQDPILDPEPMVRTLSEMVIAGRLVSGDERVHRLSLVTEDLGQSITHVMALIAEQHLGRDTHHRIEDPEPGDEDRAYVESIAKRLERELGDGCVLTSSVNDETSLAVACRSRIFLADVESLTRWQVDHDWSRGRSSAMKQSDSDVT